MILIFCNFELPDSCANATRSFNIAKIVKQAGFKVKLLGVASAKTTTLSGVYEDIPYHMIQRSGSNGIMSGLRILKTKHILKNELNRIQTKEKLEAIIISNVYSEYSDIFLALKKKENIPIIVNQVEWYDKNNEIFHGPFGLLKFFGNRLALKYFHVKMQNILAISDLLGNYYRSKKCNVVVIPSIVDPGDYKDINPYFNSDSDKTIISYAGSPAKKDYISNAVLALLKLSKEDRCNIELHLYGCTEQQLISLGVSEDNIRTLDGVLFCHGRIPYKDVKKCISESDFTVLLRPNAKYANAGFPTKVSESMVCGTPVIANITSDLGKCIIDNSTGIICSDETPESCKAAFLKAMKMSKADKVILRKNAFSMAERYFFIDNYVSSVRCFIDDAIKGVD